MKLAVALLVLADLLLRGAAVPHVHASDAGDHAESHRPHVHLTWHTGEHEDSHDHAPSDHTVIYLDGGVMLFTSADQVIVAQPVVSWMEISVDGFSGAPTDSGCMPTAPRPPGDRAASIHDLLPHMLRI